MFKRTFTTPLDEHSKAKLADEFASMQADVDKIEADKKAFDGACRDKLNTLYPKLSELAATVRSGTHQVLVECEWRPHPTATRMQLHRLDKAEDDASRIVDERPMSDVEKQGKLDERFNRVIESAPKTEEAPAPEPDKAAKKDPECPALLGERDEIWKFCKAPGTRRSGGYCAAHKDRKNTGELRAMDVAARQKRQAQIDELAKAEDAAEVEDAQSDGPESKGEGWKDDLAAELSDDSHIDAPEQDEDQDAA